MKTILFSLACAGALLVPGAGLLRATDGVRPVPGAMTGKVLVLGNGRTLEGDIERVGDQYRVRRLVGETWVPARAVQYLGRTMEEAHAFLQSRANLQDADERLRLAEWCRLHGLRAQALDEVRSAVRLRPDHAPSRRLLTYLEQAAQRPAAPGADAPHPGGREADAGPVPEIDLTTDCLSLFTTRVQPILMNACAGCHAVGRGGTFKLTRAYGAGLEDRKAVQRNLAAVLAQVNLNQPPSSPLLTKAVSIHGPMTQAALRSRQVPPYRTLEEWVQRTLANNPQLRDRIPPSPNPAAAEAKSPSPPGARPANEWGQDRGPATAAGPAVPEAPRAPPGAGQPPPLDTQDPVNPDVFNRQMHPERFEKTNRQADKETGK